MTDIGFLQQKLWKIIFTLKSKGNLIVFGYLVKL